MGYKVGDPVRYMGTGEKTFAIGRIIEVNEYETGTSIFEIYKIRFHDGEDLLTLSWFIAPALTLTWDMGNQHEKRTTEGQMESHLHKERSAAIQL